MTTSNSPRTGLTGPPAATASSALLGFCRHHAVGKHDERELGPLGSRGDQLPALVRIGQAEVVHHRTLLERLAQLVGPARPGVGHDVHRVRRGPVRLPPFQQHARDRLVEQLVWRLCRPDHVVIEPSVSHALEDLVADRLLAPVPKAHQQGPLGAGVDMPDLGEQLDRACRPAGQHQGDLDARSGKIRKFRTRVFGGLHADHLVVPRVPIAQLAFNVARANSDRRRWRGGRVGPWRAPGHMLRATVRRDGGVERKNKLRYFQVFQNFLSRVVVNGPLFSTFAGYWHQPPLSPRGPRSSSTQYSLSSSG